jgi:hypothetical protein
MRPISMQISSKHAYLQNTQVLSESLGFGIVLGVKLTQIIHGQKPDKFNDQQEM